MQRQELIETFRDYLIARYSDRLSAYADSGRTPVVLGAHPVEDGVLVSSEVVFGRSPTQGGRGAPVPPLVVDWRLVAEDGGYKIADVIVDGVSMAITQRSEFADEIQREGGQLPALVANLREQTAGAGR
jgi:phospholipid transport system substrate-binding protein